MTNISLILAVFLIIIAGFIIYSNSFHNQFVFDDMQLVVNNSIIRSLGNIPGAFNHDLNYFTDEKEGKFYRPIQTLTYMIDYRFSGLNSLGYHITNTILHILVCILLFYVISIITADSLLSFLATLLYLVHPVHAEAVTYISGRADSLCSIFLLLMLIFQFKYWNAKNKFGRLIYYLVIMASFALALLSKELAAMFPLLLMFTEYCLRGKEKYEGILNKRIFFYIPLIILLIIWFWLKNAIVPTEAMVIDPNALKLSTNLKVVPKVIFDYIKISFLPLNMHMEYQFPFPQSLFQKEYFGPFIFILFFIPLIYFAWKKGKYDGNYRIMFFGLGWFIIALLPYLNIFFHLNAVFSEHWLYIPEMGLIIFMVSLLFYISRKREAYKKAVVLLCLIAAIIFSCLTIRQNMVWKDKFTFYSYTLKYAPYSAKIYNNLAVEYINKKDITKAKELLEKAVEVDPNYSIAAENLQHLKRESL